jgi:predicted nucleic acid-binding protein
LKEQAAAQGRSVRELILACATRTLLEGQRPSPKGVRFPLITSKFRKYSRLSSSSPKVWADAYLLAFASLLGLKLVTFDRGLEARGADVFEQLPHRFSRGPTKETASINAFAPETPIITMVL